MRRIAVSAVAVVSLAGAPQAFAAQPSPAALSGPPGASASKVLVIGTDGTRFDLVNRVIAQRGAPNLERLAAEGLAVPSLLAYEPPEAATISEVGWCSVASGVWPDKHGVNGMFANNDPRQATKNGYIDFLSRIEQVRPGLSTFLASNWANIGLHENGGPIFGDAIDARFAVAAQDDIEKWDASDQEVTEVAARYLREGDPDAGFVYLGIPDIVAHNDGSANPRYLQAIRDTDRRIGQLLHAIRARPTYLEERWLVIVTTDHGQQHLSYPSTLSHGFGSDLERLSFVAAAGFGFERPRGFADIRVVDVAPTVLARLGIPIAPEWNLDGRPFAAPPAAPPPIATGRRRGRQWLRLLVRARAGAPPIESLQVRLPRRLRIAEVRTNPRATVQRSARRALIRAAGTRRLRIDLRLRTPARSTFAGSRVRLLVTDAERVRTPLTARVR